MNLETLFAWRYLFSPKSHSVINAISFVAGVSIVVPTAALILLLSVFNGIGSMMESLYNNFDPQIKVYSVNDKFFKSDTIVSKLIGIDNIDIISPYIEDNALAGYKDNKIIISVRGVDQSYKDVVPLDTLIRIGKYELLDEMYTTGVIGMGVGYDLGVNVNLAEPIKLLAPNPNAAPSFIPSSFYRSTDIYPSGVFAIDAETDSKYIFLPMSAAQDLFGVKDKVSAIAISLKDVKYSDKTKSEIKSLLGSGFYVQDRYEQKATMYKLMRSEKYIIFFVVLLVVTIALCTLIGSTVMIIAEKQKQTEVLGFIGATNRFIKRCFIYQGVILAIISIFVGVILGVTLSLLQQHYGIIEISSQTLLIDSYPVRLEVEDVLLVIVSILMLSMGVITSTVNISFKK